MQPRMRPEIRPGAPRARREHVPPHRAYERLREALPANLPEQIAGIVGRLGGLPDPLSAGRRMVAVGSATPAHGRRNTGI
jgi:hypothetical protein